MLEYIIWFQRHCDGKWHPTTYTVKARTDNEAQARLLRKFAGAGFSSMSLVAVIKGNSPL